MDNNGPSYKPQKLGSSSQALGPLKQVEVQRVIREKIIVVPRVGDIWIPVDTNIKNYCSQFYKPELDNWIEEANHIFKITCYGKDFHMLCWFYYTNLHGHFFWKYDSRNDMDYNIRIRSNKLQFVE
jgi:hypothetical protein